MTKRVPISFEFFPPKTDAGAENLRRSPRTTAIKPRVFSLLMVLVVLLVNALCSH
jgi:5,10-methylenetetrahydrofolate reductase